MSNWFSYDWELRGAPARFQVDLAFAEPDSACRRYATLLYVSCDARRAGAGSFSFWERRHLAPVLARCSTLLDGHGQHVGTIALPAHTRYYFYADDARLIVPIYEFCTDYAGLHLACAKADDPQQQTYFQLLYPGGRRATICRRRAASTSPSPFLRPRRAPPSPPKPPPSALQPAAWALTRRRKRPIRRRCMRLHRSSFAR